MHRFAVPIPVGRLCAALQQQPDDAGLLLTRVRRTAPASPGGLNGQVQGRRPGLVWLPRLRPAIQQRSYCWQRPRSHGSVQRRHTRAIHSVGICANRYEVLDRLSLCRRIPSVGVRRIVKRLCPAAISRSAIRSGRDQERRNRTPKCCGSHVKRRIARIQVMRDVGVEKS